jgi:hypothetical protein
MDAQHEEQVGEQRGTAVSDGNTSRRLKSLPRGQFAPVEEAQAELPSSIPGA